MVNSDRIPYLYVPETIPYGSGRRAFIKQWFDAHPNGMYAVNCKHRPQLKNDPDLTRLIKEKYLARVRVSHGGLCRRTYLVKRNVTLEQANVYHVLQLPTKEPI